MIATKKKKKKKKERKKNSSQGLYCGVEVKLTCTYSSA
jgi:putative lipoic acid-binding regulatory protein